MWNGEYVHLEPILLDFEATYMFVKEVGYLRKRKKNSKTPLPKYITKLDQLQELHKSFYKKDFEECILNKFKEGENFVTFWF